MLDHGTKTFGPIRGVIGALIECTDMFENLSKQREEYRELQRELELIFKQLQGYCGEAMPQGTTAILEGLCKSILQEILYIREKQGRGAVRQYIGAGDDADEILQCYRRIQSDLQRVVLNMNVSMWRTVDRISVNNQMDRMAPSLSACYRSSQAAELKRGPCTQGTRVDLLAQLLAWADNTEPGSVFWMSGMAGTGKTTIAYSLCEELEAKGRLAASFFCSRLLPECRDITRVIPTIAYQLARFSYPFRCALFTALEKDPDLHTCLPWSQFQGLIVQPLLEVQSTLPDTLVVVIDALDECESKESTNQVLEVLITHLSDLPVRFVVSSRPEPEIREGMTKRTIRSHSRIVLHELDKHSVQADIEKYLRVALARIQPSEDQMAELVRRAGVLFIYAATVVRYIGYNNFRGNWNTRLENVLSLTRAGEKQNMEIDELYSTILQAAMENPDLETTDVNDMRQVLHTVICAQEPLTVDKISRFLNINNPDRVRSALLPLWSVLHISSPSELVATLHASFSDYILDPSRSHQYCCDPLVQNRNFALRCFDFLRDMRPQFNVCDLESSFISDDEVVGLEERVKCAISEDVFYAARYWASHLCSTIESPDLLEQLEEFLSVRLMLWMEVMNLKGCKGSMPAIIRMTEKQGMSYRSALRELLHDARRFTTTFSSSSVSESTPHIYTSMLPFWPTSSPVAKLYTKYTQGIIGLEGTATARIQRTLLAVWNYEDAGSLSFSPDGSQIAVRLDDDVVLLDASTGQMVFPRIPMPHFDGAVKTLYPENHPVRFCPNGAVMVSTGKRDSTGFCIWSTHDGKQLLSGEMSRISALAFSPNGAQIAFGLANGTVNILDARTGQRLKNLATKDASEQDTGGNWTEAPTKENCPKVIAVKYSLDNRYIVACDTHGGIATWDRENWHPLKKQCRYGSNRKPESADISPDCVYFASGCGNTINIWIIETGQVRLGPLQVTPNLDPGEYHHESINSICYSPDGLHLVCGSSCGTICIWDTHTGDILLRILEAHTKSVRWVSFSPDGAYVVSSGFDKTIRLWDVRRTQVECDPLPGHSRPLTSVGFSQDGNRIVSSAEIWDHNICVWDADTGGLVLKLLPPHHTENDITYSSSAAYSHDGARIIVLTGLAMRSLSSGLVETSILYPAHRSSTQNPAALSEYNTRVLSVLSTNSAQVVASRTSDTVLLIHPPIEDKFSHVTAGMVLFDGGQFYKSLGCQWLTYTYKHLAIYDACGGHLLSELHNGDYIDSSLVQFSPDGTQAACITGSAIVVRNGQSGDQVLGPLEGHAASVEICSIHWSPDGSQIVSGARDNTICVWDACTSHRTLGPIKWHTGRVASVRFSPDSTRIVSGSEDKAIRVTDVRAWASIVAPDSLTSTGSDWELNADGWAIDGQGRLLAWVPPEMRTVLMYPRTKLIISRDGWLRMNFSGAYLGESWAKCYQ